MPRVIKDKQIMDDNHVALLNLMQPGLWYCFSDYAGCTAIPESGNRVNGRVFAPLVGRGFVESVPVFEGFMTEKHRITPKGIAWLKAR